MIGRRDHSGYVLGQWDPTLQFNVSHWLSPYSEWSLRLPSLFCFRKYVHHLCLYSAWHLRNVQTHFMYLKNNKLGKRFSFDAWMSATIMDLLQDTQNWGLRMRRECWERFPRHRIQRKLLVSNPSMKHSTCVTHVPWCMSGSLNRDVRENVPGACATNNFMYLVRGLCRYRSVGAIRNTASQITGTVGRITKGFGGLPH